MTTSSLRSCGCSQLKTHGGRRVIIRQSHHVREGPSKSCIHGIGQGQDNRLVPLVQDVIHQIQDNLSSELARRDGDLWRSKGIIIPVQGCPPQDRGNHRIHTRYHIQADLQEMLPIPLASETLGKVKLNYRQGIIVCNRQRVLGQDTQDSILRVDQINDQGLRVFVSQVLNQGHVETSRSHPCRDRERSCHWCIVLALQSRSAQDQVRADHLPRGSRQNEPDLLHPVCLTRRTAAQDKGQGGGHIVVSQGHGVRLGNAQASIHCRTQQDGNRLVRLVEQIIDQAQIHQHRLGASRDHHG